MSEMVHLLVKTGERERATELAGFVLHHPATNQDHRSQIEQTLEELQSHLSPQAMAEALERDRARQLEEVVAEVLSG